MITKFKFFENVENKNLLMCVDPGELKNITIGEKIYEIDWHHDCGWYVRDIKNPNKTFSVEPFPYKDKIDAMEFHHQWGAIFSRDNSIEEYKLRKASEKFGI